MRKPVWAIVIALAIPLCLIAGWVTTAFASVESCQQRGLSQDFCTKANHHSDLAAVLPDVVAHPDGDLVPDAILPLRESPDLPSGCFNLPVGRAPPLV